MVHEFQKSEYDNMSSEDLGRKIKEGKLKSHFTSTTSMIIDDPDIIKKKLDDFKDV